MRAFFHQNVKMTNAMALMSSEYSRVFRLLDKYSRSQHQCFLAELFPSDVKGEHLLCFRPVSAAADSSDLACRYLRVKDAELRLASQAKLLTDSLVERLDQELATLGEKA
jgi:hypothetical protein